VVEEEKEEEVVVVEAPVRDAVAHLVRALPPRSADDDEEK